MKFSNEMDDGADEKRRTRKRLRSLRGSVTSRARNTAEKLFTKEECEREAVGDPLANKRVKGGHGNSRDKLSEARDVCIWKLIQSRNKKKYLSEEKLEPLARKSSSERKRQRRGDVTVSVRTD